MSTNPPTAEPPWARYRIGRGETGVLTYEPYKSALLPLWSFRTCEVARKSSSDLWDAFLAYEDEDDFVGMDMARKILQMGMTRAKRYASHKGGKKYGAGGKGNGEILDGDGDGWKGSEGWKEKDVVEGIRNRFVGVLVAQAAKTKGPKSQSSHCPPPRNQHSQRCSSSQHIQSQT